MKKSIIPVLAVLAASGLSAQTTTYLYNTFGAGSHNNTGSGTQSDGVTDVGAADINNAVVGASTQWYSNAATNTATAGTGTLNLLNANGSNLAYFASTPVSIATPGDSISVSFNFKTTGTVASSTFKVALLDTQGNLMQTAGYGSSYTSFTKATINSVGSISNGSSSSFIPTAAQPYLNWTGVYGTFNPLASSISLYTKALPNESSVNTAFMTNTGSLGSVLSTSATGAALAAGTLYSYNMTITYNSATAETVSTTIMQGATTIDSDVFSGSINQLGGTAFDTVALNPNTSAGSPGWALSNILVTTTAVPEPSVYALLAGVVSLMGVGFMRARSRRAA